MSLPASPSSGRRGLVVPWLLLAAPCHGLWAPLIQGMSSPAATVSSTGVINEFRVRGPKGGSHELIELYNWQVLDPMHVRPRAERSGR